MPFTFTHPALILPFKKYQKYFSFTALIIGSLAPDFEYFIRFQLKSTISHTLLSLFIFNLPLIFLLSYLFHKIVKNQFNEHSPKPLDSWFKTIAEQNWSINSISTLFIFIYSALIGIFSHILWDSFTHINGFFVTRISLFNETIIKNIPLYKILQHLSTLLGLIIILIFNSLLLVGALLFFMHGSFEMFPTPEDQEGIRIVFGSLSFIFLIIEIILIRLIKK